MNLKIRNETKDDIDAIEKITTEAFLTAPYSDHTEQHIVRALRNSDVLSISLVAEYQGEVVGHVAVSPITISDGAKGWFGLGPISVSPTIQKSGVGSQLMESAVETLKKSGASGCVLLGNPAYYYRFGFKPESSLVYPGAPPEYFQAILFSGLLPNGKVAYHQAFNAKA
ncbi:MAG: N-acetyltransferase [Oceanicoccus sp.]